MVHDNTDAIKVEGLLGEGARQYRIADAETKSIGAMEGCPAATQSFQVESKNLSQIYF